MSIEDPNNPEDTIEQEKPPFLYHGTVLGDIDSFEPRGSADRPNENAAVYASHDERAAVMSMANKYAAGGGIQNDTWYMYIPMTREEFMAIDHGGSVYKLPSDSFRTNREHGLGDFEWVSNQPVKPTEKIDYPSILEALLEQNIKVFFVTQETVDKIEEMKKAGDYNAVADMIDSLPSENDRRVVDDN
jgi:hypothetical protein